MNTELPTVKQKGGVLAVAGAIDAHTVLPLRAEGERLIKTASGSLVVDLEGLTTTHSAALSMLLCWSRLAEKQGVSLSFTGAPERLVSLAALSNLADWLQSRP
ncbi:MULTISPECIES: lipid asymmetry maintenance protein MlaB [unclassified Marinobacter]|uniref:STAS domain-containing protein n=1 Tax=unclassified Marinobacter TaxID=83889 RepID=UPI0026E27693|nr:MULTISPECIES: STAS domain-containing protein [unclassified Marinobacter]MDO6443749.1 STAS domain-containing protein [Marinobacter sp. 2_MG-2023]MDO6823261.1 STAS domain-containing protein [Marinobacter sp. 1_MG-2023]